MKDERHNLPSLFTAHDLLDYLKQRGQLLTDQPPEKVLLLFSPALAHKARQRWVTKTVSFLGAQLDFVSEREGLAWLSGFGLGAPALAAKVEELIAWGVKDFVGLGMAGTLNDAFAVGQLVIVEKALRGEGCSARYQSSNAEFTNSNAELSQAVARCLDSDVLQSVSGDCWTTDTPYRETRADLNDCKEKQVGLVDMETAALFAVTSYHQRRSAALLVASDRLNEQGWQPCFHHQPVKKSLDKALDALTRHI